MSLSAPYFGNDIETLQQECSVSLAKHYASEPKEDLSAFRATVQGFGEVWAELCDRVDGTFVVAGIVGNMSGVPIALFAGCDRDAALRYARDFEAGKTFTISNDARWCDYVNAAMSVKKLNSGDRANLISRGRKTGITLSGVTHTQESLQAAYLAGEF